MVYFLAIIKYTNHICLYQSINAEHFPICLHCRMGKGIHVDLGQYLVFSCPHRDPV